jgi:transcriptional regulator with XRE-family HTH domain
MGKAEPGSFGELLRLHRMANGLTQGELAARAGLSTRCIRNLERGLHLLPNADARRRLADAWVSVIRIGLLCRPLAPSQSLHT